MTATQRDAAVRLHDDLELAAETVEDLDVAAEDADAARGGFRSDGSACF